MLLITGCATTATVRHAPAEQDRVYLLDQDCSTVFAALPAALDSLNLDLRRDNASSTDCPVTIIARKGISAFSWGEIVRIRLTPVAGGGTELRVHTRRALATNITARGDWSPHVHKALLVELTGSDS